MSIFVKVSKLLKLIKSQITKTSPVRINSQKLIIILGK